MDEPPPTVIRDFRSDLDEPPDQPFHRPFDFFAHEAELPEHVKEGMHSPMQCIYRMPSFLFVLATLWLEGVKSRGKEISVHQLPVTRCAKKQ